VTQNVNNHDPQGDGPGAAGGIPMSLADRVRSLRLPGQMAAGSGGGGRAWVPWALVGLLALATFYLGSLVASMPPADAGKGEGKRASVKARAGGAQYATRGVVFEAKGYVIPIKLIQVSPKIGGMVEKLYVIEGKPVKEGAELCRIEKVNYKADYDRAAAALKAARHRLEETERSWPDETEQARAEWESAVAEYKQLKLNFQRTVALKKRGSAAAFDFEQAEALERSMQRKVDRLKLAYQVMRGPRKQRIDAARAEVRQAEADLAKAEWQLDNCVVYAPISGTILTKKTEEGNIVNPIAFNISASICEMADLTQLEIDLTIQERDIAKIFRGQKCRIRPDAASEKVFAGRVSRIMPNADRAKGTVSVRVRVLDVSRKDEGKYLRPEGAALVSFLGAGEGQAPAVKDGPGKAKKQ
jgi:HlyD family secretion protein